MTQGSQISSVTTKRGGIGKMGRRRGHMFIYDLLMLMFGWNQHNPVKQSHFNQKINKFKIKKKRSEL